MHCLPVVVLLPLLCIASHPTAASSSAVDAANKPHIFMLLVDDWGWANVGYHRDPPTKEVQTPTFDRLAKKEGVELDQHYAHCACSPSRSSLLTGRHPIHVNVDNGDVRRYNDLDPVSGFQGIPRNMTAIAQKLKQAGYATHQVGKWDAGMATPDHTPKGRGFDSSLGYFHHMNDYYTEQQGICLIGFSEVTDFWETDGEKEGPAYGKNGTVYEEQMFAARVLEIVENHNVSQPLFLYYAPHIVHGPLQVPREYEDKFSFIDDGTRRLYHAMVTYLDDVVNNVTQAFIKKGMWNNTLMVVSSDNGGPEYFTGGANNYPLKGGKLSNWQGGVRVNAFVTGGLLPEAMRGTTLDGYVALCDWYTTFCRLADVDPTDERAAEAKLPPVDGLDMWPYISGMNKTSPRVDVPLGPNIMSNVVQRGGHAGLISGNYKILVGEIGEAGWTGPQYPNNTNPGGGFTIIEDCGTGCLFDIIKDPEERQNLAQSMPGVLKDMQQKFETMVNSMFSPNRGLSSPLACESVRDRYHGYWGPFLP